MVEKNGHSTKRGVLHTRPLGNLVALSWKPESICSPCELLLILCSFVLGGEDAYDCHVFRKTLATICKETLFCMPPMCHLDPGTAMDPTSPVHLRSL